MGGVAEASSVKGLVCNLRFVFYSEGAQRILKQRNDMHFLCQKVNSRSCVGSGVEQA